MSSEGVVCSGSFYGGSGSSEGAGGGAGGCNG